MDKPYKHNMHTYVIHQKEDWGKKDYLKWEQGERKDHDDEYGESP